MVPRGWGRGQGGETANSHRVSFQGDGNVLELVVLVAHHVNKTRPIKSYTSKVQFMVDELFLIEKRGGRRELRLQE